MADIQAILSAAQSRIARIGEQEMQILDAQLQAMAERMALGFSRVEFTDKRLLVVSDTAGFGHGTEPSVFVPGKFEIAMRGNGVPIRYAAELFGTMPEHAYPVVRITTPNMLITPVMAARLYMNDNLVRKQLAEQRTNFIEHASQVLTSQIEKLYGTLEVIPFDFLGTMTIMDKPHIHVWRNIVGDIVGYRWEVYVGYNVLPGRGMAAKPDEGVTPLNADVTHIDSIGEPDASAN